MFPGGGYNVLAIDLEGTEACDWLTSKGTTCSVGCEIDRLVLGFPAIRKVELEFQVGMEELILPEETFSWILAENEAVSALQKCIALHLEVRRE